MIVYFVYHKFYLYIHNLKRNEFHMNVYFVILYMMRHEFHLLLLECSGVLWTRSHSEELHVKWITNI